MASHHIEQVGGLPDWLQHASPPRNAMPAHELANASTLIPAPTEMAGAASKAAAARPGRRRRWSPVGQQSEAVKEAVSPARALKSEVLPAALTRLAASVSAPSSDSPLPRGGSSDAGRAARALSPRVDAPPAAASPRRAVDLPGFASDADAAGPPARRAPLTHVVDLPGFADNQARPAVDAQDAADKEFVTMLRPDHHEPPSAAAAAPRRRRRWNDTPSDDGGGAAPPDDDGTWDGQFAPPRKAEKRKPSRRRSAQMHQEQQRSRAQPQPQPQPPPQGRPLGGGVNARADRDMLIAMASLFAEAGIDVPMASANVDSGRAAFVDALRELKGSAPQPSLADAAAARAPKPRRPRPRPGRATEAAAAAVSPPLSPHAPAPAPVQQAPPPLHRRAADAATFSPLLVTDAPAPAAAVPLAPVPAPAPAPAPTSAAARAGISAAGIAALRRLEGGPPASAPPMSCLPAVTEPAPQQREPENPFANGAKLARTPRLPDEIGAGAGSRPPLSPRPLPPRSPVVDEADRAPLEGTAAPPLQHQPQRATSSRSPRAVSKLPKRARPASSARSEQSTASGAVPLSVARQRLLDDKEREAARDRDPVTRKNLDKKTARNRYGMHFVSFIKNYRQQHTELLPTGSGADAAVRASEETAAEGDRTPGNRGVDVYVRKRPIFEYEIGRGEYDVVSTEATGAGVLIHDCQMHADMRRMLHNARRFPCTAAFPSASAEADVYRATAAPLVRAATQGGVGAVLMYGQTGSGKTHTMGTIEHFASDDLFNLVGEGGTVTLTFFELAGKKAIDLLSPASGRELRLLDAEDGCSCSPHEACFKVCRSTQELEAALARGKARRATASTDVNGQSSRSHAVAQLVPRAAGNLDGPAGTLTLVDCAGSERRHDSLYHSSERQKESTEINVSLYALKECIRASADIRRRDAEGRFYDQREKMDAIRAMPFRQSTLTRILKEGFVRADARLMVVACVSPTATDTEHSIGTLRCVATLTGTEDDIALLGSVEVPQAQASHLSAMRAGRQKLHPKRWTADETKEWLRDACGGAFRGVSDALQHNLDGKALMKYTAKRFAAAFGGDTDLAAELFGALRSQGGKAAQADGKARAQARRIAADGAAHRNPS